MKALVHTYQQSVIHNILKYIIVLSIAMFMAAQPIIEIVFNFADVEYQLYEDMEDNDTSKKEELKKKKSKERKPDVPTSLEPGIGTYSYKIVFHELENAGKAPAFASEIIPGLSLEVLPPPPEQVSIS